MATPSDPAAALPGRPPAVDLATWQAARDELLVREKAHTREGDAIAAARRRLPMVELDGTVEVVGPDQPARAAVDPPRRDPRGDPRPARPPPLTRLRLQAAASRALPPEASRRQRCSSLRADVLRIQPVSRQPRSATTGLR
jgi:uncharacterized protein DUF899